jgi:8-oxo-dGTP pyrophosphatase MutT (NUDIX family)
MSVSPARPASTVVLLRPSPARFDVFLVRRHDNVAFMGGAHVFPGGRVDAADRLDQAEPLCDGVTGALARMDGVPVPEAIGHHVAGIRELFEEAGVLLARRTGGHIIGFRDPVEKARFTAYRGALASGSVTLRALAESERLRLALDELSLFAHWRTPQIETKRFDTRFFVAVLPEGQEPVHDDSETTDSAWLDPADALVRCRRDDIMLPPPTWTTLQLLAAFTSVDAVTRWARQRPVVCVEPGFLTMDGRTLLTLPGDPLHPAIDGFETPGETRFELDKGRWRAVRA